jgi:hypothetical protein
LKRENQQPMIAQEIILDQQQSVSDSQVSRRFYRAVSVFSSCAFFGTKTRASGFPSLGNCQISKLAKMDGAE